MLAQAAFPGLKKKPPEVLPKRSQSLTLESQRPENHRQLLPGVEECWYVIEIRFCGQYGAVG
jgi:hypothetical protein